MTIPSRSLFIELNDDDRHTLEHVARSCGEPVARVGGQLLSAALHADRLVHEITEKAKARQPADEPDDDWPPTPAA